MIEMEAYYRLWKGVMTGIPYIIMVFFKIQIRSVNIILRYSNLKYLY